MNEWISLISTERASFICVDYVLSCALFHPSSCLDLLQYWLLQFALIGLPNSRLMLYETAYCLMPEITRKAQF